MKLEYCSTMSPYYPTLKLSVTHNIQPKTEQNVPTNTKPLNLTISLSQSKAISTQILSFFLSISRSASQSHDLPLNLAIIPHKYSHSPSQSRDLPQSPSPSCSRSPCRAVAHAFGLPLTRYVSLNSHVQLVGIFVCKFIIFMHSLILGFDPEINLILGFDQFS